MFLPILKRNLPFYKLLKCVHVLKVRKSKKQFLLFFKKQNKAKMVIISELTLEELKPRKVDSDIF